MPINEYGGAGTLRRFKMVIDKKSKDRDKQLEFEFPKKKFDRDISNDYNNKAKTGKQEEKS